MKKLESWSQKSSCEERISDPTEIYYSRYVLELEQGDEKFFIRLVPDGTEVGRPARIEPDSGRVPTYFPTEQHALDKLERIKETHLEHGTLRVVLHSRVPYFSPVSQ